MCSHTVSMADSLLLFLVNSNKWIKNLMKNQPQLLSRNAFKHALRGGYLWHHVSWTALPLTSVYYPYAETNQDFEYHFLKDQFGTPCNLSNACILDQRCYVSTTSQNTSVTREECENAPITTSTSALWYHTTVQFLPLCLLRDLYDQFMKTVRHEKSRLVPKQS